MKKLTAMLLVSLLLLGLCGCGNTPSAPSGDGMTVTDMIGRQVSLNPGSYKKIVCIGAGALRMYSYIGDIGALCGVEDIDNPSLDGRPRMFDGTARPYVLAYGDEFSSLPSCGVGGPNAQSAEAEKILSCGADIVFSEYEDVEKADALQEQLGVPVITLKTGVGGVFDPAFSDSIALLGTVLGRQTRSQELIAYVQAQTAEIQSRTADIEDADKPSVYVCGLGNWGTTNHLMTAPSYISFDIANVKNVLGDMPLKGVQPIDEEKFVSVGEDTDIIIMDAAAIKNIIPLYRESPDMFEVCRAWREGRVYLQMAYNAYYTNYETALINTWFIAKTVYPDRFEDIDIDEKADEVTTAFLGMPLTEKIKSCPNSFGGWGRIEPDMFMG